MAHRKFIVARSVGEARFENDTRNQRQTDSVDD